MFMKSRRSSSSSLLLKTLVIFSSFFIFNVVWLNISLEQFLSPEESSTTISNKKQRSPDGFFNGYPVYFYDSEVGTKKNFYSSSHCIGENYQTSEKTAASTRSCQYTFICFDLQNQDFVVFQPPTQDYEYEILKQRPFLDISQSFLQTPFQNNTISFSSSFDTNQKWSWSPRILPADKYPTSFFAFDDKVVIIPFYSSLGSSKNQSSSSSYQFDWIVWNDFFNMYTLMTMFELRDKIPVPLRVILTNNGKDAEKIGQLGLVSAICDALNSKSRDDCEDVMFNMMWPLIRPAMYIESKLTNTQNAEWIGTSNKSAQYVCSRHGLAGRGGDFAAPDQGFKWKERRRRGYVEKNNAIITRNNHGRSSIFWDFRQFAMANVGIYKDPPLQPPYNIIASIMHPSSVRTNHSRDDSEFLSHAAYILKRNLDPIFAVVNVHYFDPTSQDLLENQVRVASEAAIFITSCGGDGTLAAASFVQKGSTILAYYEEGARENKKSGETEEQLTRRIGSSVLNNLGYAHVHWMSKEDMIENEDTLVALVRTELNRIASM